MENKPRILLIDTPKDFAATLPSHEYHIDCIHLFSPGRQRQRIGSLYEYEIIVFSPSKINPSITFSSLSRQTCDAIEKSGTIVILFLNSTRWIDSKKESHIELNHLYQQFCPMLRIEAKLDQESNYVYEPESIGQISRLLEQVPYKRPIRSTVSVSSWSTLWPSQHTVFPLAGNRIKEYHSFILRYGKGALIVLPEYENNAEVTKVILESIILIKRIPILEVESQVIENQNPSPNSELKVSMQRSNHKTNGNQFLSKRKRTEQKRNVIYTPWPRDTWFVFQEKTGRICLHFQNEIKDLCLSSGKKPQEILMMLKSEKGDDSVNMITNKQMDTFLYKNETPKKTIHRINRDLSKKLNRIFRKTGSDIYEFIKYRPDYTDFVSGLNWHFDEDH